jgi:hypothetical protein
VTLVQLVIDYLFKDRNENTAYDKEHSNVFGSFFLIGIYFVFIVVFFGFIAGSNNKEIMLTNMEVFLFQNWFFNVNLFIIILERFFIHFTNQPVKIYFSAFNPNAVVLHISIILGAVLMLLVVKNYPEIFTPNNRWGSVVIVAPFLILKGIATRLHLKS